MMKKILLTAISSAFILSACSSDDDKNTNASTSISLGVTTFLRLNGSDIKVQDNATSGNGTLVGETPLGSVASGKNFELKANLESGGYVTLVAYGDAKAENGLNFKFSNQNGSLSVIASKAAWNVDLSSKFSGRSATELNYFIDVHNDETPAHIIIWGENFNDAPLYDSEEEGHPEFSANGNDTFFAATLQSGSLKSLVPSNPKLEGE